MYSLTQNADLVTITILSMVIGSSAPRGHYLSTRKNMNRKEITPVFCVKILHRTRRPKLLPSVFLSLESSMMFTHHCHTDTMNLPLFLTFIHVTDQKMVTQLFKSGVRTFWISETISDVTSVPGVPRLTLYLHHSFGADRPSQKSSVKLSHSRYRLIDSRIHLKMLNTGITTNRRSQKFYQILDL